MRGMVAIIGLLSMAFAGCVTEPLPSSVDDENPNRDQASLSSAGNFTTDGPGWVFSYRAQDPPTDDYNFAGSFDFATTNASGPHSAAIFVAVPVRLLGDGTLAPQLDFFIDVIERSSDGSVIDRSASFFGGGSARPNPTAGYMFVAASDAAFTFNYELTLPEGISIDPYASFDLQGNGTSFHYAGGLPGHVATFKTMAVELAEAGWSHFQVLLGQGMHTAGLSATHATFPSERRESEVSVYGPTYGLAPLRYAGVIKDTPGAFYGQSLNVETFVDMELLLLHMPGVAASLGSDWRTGPYTNKSPPVRTSASADRFQDLVWEEL